MRCPAEDNEDETTGGNEDQKTGLLSDDRGHLNSAQLSEKLQRLSKMKLIILKGSFFVVGVVVVIIAGILSQFHLPNYVINGNFSECSDDIMNDERFDLLPSPSPCL